MKRKSWLSFGSTVVRTDQDLRDALKRHLESEVCQRISGRYVEELECVFRLCPKFDGFGRLMKVWIETNSESRCGRGYRLVGADGRVERLVPEEVSGYEAHVDAVLRRVQQELGTPVLTWINPPGRCSIHGHWAVGSNGRVRKIKQQTPVRDIEGLATRCDMAAEKRNLAEFEAWMQREALSILDRGWLIDSSDHNG